MPWYLPWYTVFDPSPVIRNLGADPAFPAVTTSISKCVSSLINSFINEILLITSVINLCKLTEWSLLDSEPYRNQRAWKKWPNNRYRPYLVNKHLIRLSNLSQIRKWECSGVCICVFYSDITLLYTANKDWKCNHDEYSFHIQCSIFNSHFTSAHWLNKDKFDKTSVFASDNHVDGRCASCYVMVVVIKRLLRHFFPYSTTQHQSEAILKNCEKAI